MLPRLILIVVIVVNGGFFATKAEGRFSWPLVKPTQRTYVFSDASRASFSVKLAGQSGRDLYLLKCANTDLPEGEQFRGDFACWMKAIDESTRPGVEMHDLLASTPFHGSRMNRPGGGFDDREQVWSWQLTGACGEYPDYGRTRVFRLRGLRLTLTFQDVELAHTGPDPSLQSFDLEMLVEQDPQAITAIAAPSPFTPPSNTASCKDIQRRPKSQHDASESYPKILSTSFDFDFPVPISNPEKVAEWGSGLELRHSVRTEGGADAYSLFCKADERTGDRTPIPFVVGIRSGQWGTGIWCALAEISSPESNLLDLTVDPYTRTSRAEIFPDQLWGACADYPDWGRKRIFRLRQIELTMNMDRVEFKRVSFSLVAGYPAAKLTHVTIHVTVRPDPTAVSQIPAEAQYADWSLLPTTCSRPVPNAFASE